MVFCWSLAVTLVLAVCLQPASSWWKGNHPQQGCLPQHCAWGYWSAWGPCPAGCGREGHKRRTRVQEQQASCGGRACTGSHNEMRPCRGECGATDEDCLAVGGLCGHEVHGCSHGNLVAGLCPSHPKYIKCCVPSSACTVAQYNNTNIGGGPTYVDADFRPWMDKINQAAAKCGVQVSVERSFILVDRPASEAPRRSCQSSLPTGHGITFTARSGGTACNATCLLERYHDDSLCDKDPFKCFLLGAQDAGLRWGGAWNGHLEGGHLDDNFFFRNPCRHSDYWRRLQASCKHLPVPTLREGQ